MKNKKSYLLLFLIICISTISACNNYHIDVLEGEPTLESEEEKVSHLSLIEGNRKKTQYETLSKATNVSMEIVEDSITPTGFNIVYKNNSGKNIIFKDDFIIETRLEEDWYELPMLTRDYDFRDAGCKMPYNQSKELSADWKKLYGDLKTGEYRIIKEVIDLSDPNSYNKEYFAAEFEIH